MAIHTLIIKGPNVIGDFLEAIRNKDRPPNLTEEEWKAVQEVRVDSHLPALQWLQGFFEYGEYLIVEFDDVGKTATVVRRRE